MRNRSESEKEFSRLLIRWYESNKRSLPWRATRDPYKIWVSEVMLQQTTVQTVIPYYEKWIVLFPDLQAFSRAPLQKVLKTWQGLGYYQRAKNMHKAAKIITSRFEGNFPTDYEELISLPGFGPYTTAAVLSITSDQPYPAIDANVRRVLLRLKSLKKEADPNQDGELLRFLSPLLPQKKIGTFNQAMMELGALVCRPKNPRCLLCPVSPFCQAYQDGEQEIIPTPKKNVTKKIEAVLAIIEKNGRYLIQKRPSTGLMADLWEFPGGKKQTGESLEAALRREIREELGVDVERAERLTVVRHAYTQFKVTLYAYACRLTKFPLAEKKHRRWVSLKNLRRYPFPSGSAKIVEFLENR